MRVSVLAHAASDGPELATLSGAIKFGLIDPCGAVQAPSLPSIGFFTRTAGWRFLLAPTKIPRLNHLSTRYAFDRWVLTLSRRLDHSGSLAGVQVRDWTLNDLEFCDRVRLIVEVAPRQVWVSHSAGMASARRFPLTGARMAHFRYDLIGATPGASECDGRILLRHVHSVDGLVGLLN